MKETRLIERFRKRMKKKDVFETVKDIRVLTTGQPVGRYFSDSFVICGLPFFLEMKFVKKKVVEVYLHRRWFRKNDDFSEDDARTFLFDILFDVSMGDEAKSRSFQWVVDPLLSPGKRVLGYRELKEAEKKNKSTSKCGGYLFGVSNMKKRSWSFDVRMKVKQFEVFNGLGELRKFMRKRKFAKQLEEVRKKIGKEEEEKKKIKLLEEECGKCHRVHRVLKMCGLEWLVVCESRNTGAKKKKVPKMFKISLMGDIGEEYEVEARVRVSYVAKEKLPGVERYVKRYFELSTMDYPEKMEYTSFSSNNVLGWEGEFWKMHYDRIIKDGDGSISVSVKVKDVIRMKKKKKKEYEENPIERTMKSFVGRNEVVKFQSEMFDECRVSIRFAALGMFWVLHFLQEKTKKPNNDIFIAICPVLNEVYNIKKVDAVACFWREDAVGDRMGYKEDIDIFLEEKELGKEFQWATISRWLESRKWCSDCTFSISVRLVSFE